MKIVIREYKIISPYIRLFSVHNRTGKMVLEIIGKKHLDNTDLYALEKLGFEIIQKHTNRKIL